MILVLQASVTESVTELTKVGLPINLVTYYDDIGETYSWVVKLPVQAVTLDFAGVPGSAVPCATLDLIQKHGFPSDKRLNAGVIDGRSVWADTGVASAIVGNLVNAVRVAAAPSAHIFRLQDLAPSHMPHHACMSHPWHQAAQVICTLC